MSRSNRANRQAKLKRREKLRRAKKRPDPTSALRGRSLESNSSQKRRVSTSTRSTEREVAPGPIGQRAPGWHGYADAKPSESIQQHDLPGMAVTLVFPWKPDVEMMQLPVKQYKDYKSHLKGARARQLADWLADAKDDDLVLTGFFQVDTQLNAANMGLSFLEELPETRVEPHYEGWRLHFGDEQIDFAQAVALEYYSTSINFGILRAGLKVDPAHRVLFVTMDRFPGESPSGVPGEPLPASQGSKLINFIRHRSPTGIHIESENRSIGLVANLGTLDWWKRRGEEKWRKGKSHPHFALPDWLAAAALAKAHPDEFAASLTFKKAEHGVDAVAGLAELYDAFKLYDLWSATEIVPHLRPETHVWQVPEEARAFILKRAASGGAGQQAGGD